jgi:hypothetical protein
MKAITIWQPFASLRACGAKEFETRGWATPYRGQIAIHAAAISVPRVLKRLFPLGEWSYAPNFKAKTKFVNAVDNALMMPMDDLPLGAVIATGELVACHRIVLHGGRGIHSDDPGWLETDHGIYEPTDQELLFGDWAPGRFAWEIKNVKMLPKPIPAKGKQGLWNWEAK